MNRRSLFSRAAVMAAIASPTLSLAAPSASERIIGLSLPKNGSQADVALDFEMGVRAALLGSGSSMKVLSLDDGGKPERTAENVKTLARNANVLALTGIVGTPHAQMALPVAIDNGLPVVGIRSGAASLRNGSPGVIHIRSSYNDELDTIANMCAGAGLKKVAIIHSADAFGESSREYLVSTLLKRGIATYNAIPVARDGSDLAAATAKCASDINSTNLYSGIVLLMISSTMQDASRALRQTHKIAMPIYTLSNVATRAVCMDSMPYLTGLGMVSAFPIPQSSASGMSMMFRDDCGRFGLNEIAGSLVAFEGWLYTRTIAKTDAQSRAQVLSKIQAGVTIADKFIKPDGNMVAYRHTEVTLKTSEGRLRS